MINIIINSGYSFFSLRKSLVEYLLNKEHNLKIFTPNNVLNIKNFFLSSNLSVQRYQLQDNKKNIITLFKNAINLFLFLKKEQKSTNIIFGSYLNLVFGLITFFISSKKNIFVFTGLGSFFNDEKNIFQNFVKLYFNILLLKKNSFFIFYNKSDRDYLISKKLFYKSEIILGSGIKINNKNYKKNLLSHVNFIYYSRFNFDKGLFDLIEAIKIVNKKGFERKSNFFFYGLFDSNPTSIKRSVLKKALSKFKNIYFKEINYKVNLEEIFSKKHVLILPSHREGLPKTVLEAMNFNCALLLSDIPGHKYLINKKKVNGLYFQKKSEIDLANKIIWFINNKKKILELSNNSKKNLKKFSTVNINKQFYESII